ncbi:MAG TPA: GNAT family N-acetyltransferase [Solirubrobacteraceae bacterium]|nr:GNAT family N-acetyltransferase [Solirubrobacteraceae bacterium]
MSISAPDAADLSIRPITPQDKQALLRGFERLGEASRYRRFLSPHQRLSDAELRYFTEVDHHDHEALVAIDPVTTEGVGVARYVRSRDDPARAELAVAVVDDWQRRGVGTRLIMALADRARQEGITAFTAIVLADNEMMLNLAGELGDVRIEHRELGTIETVVDLPEQGPARLRDLLRTVARGDLTPFAWHRRPNGRSPEPGQAGPPTSAEGSA